jgi:hypothetical protein
MALFFLRHTKKTTNQKNCSNKKKHKTLTPSSFSNSIGKQLMEYEKPTGPCES